MHSSAPNLLPRRLCYNRRSSSKIPNSSNPETEKSCSFLPFQELGRLSLETLRHMSSKQRNMGVHRWRPAVLDVPPAEDTPPLAELLLSGGRGSKANSDVRPEWSRERGGGAASSGAGVRPALALVAHTGPDLC